MHIKWVMSTWSMSLNMHTSECSNEVKQQAYQALVCPKLEYGIAAWNPYIKADINCIEQVQQNAARFVTVIYARTAEVSVSSMVHHSAGRHSGQGKDS